MIDLSKLWIEEGKVYILHLEEFINLDNLVSYILSYSLLMKMNQVDMGHKFHFSESYEYFYILVQDTPNRKDLV